MKKTYEHFNSRIVLVSVCIALVLLVAPAMATTTQVHIIKYASDGTTVLGETTRTYQQMESEFTILNNIELIEYFHQGIPTTSDTWNTAETNNLKTKGIVKGTDIKLLCDLVGGMNAGDTVTINPSDSPVYARTFPYEAVYNPTDAQGPMVLTWWQNGYGYPSATGYSKGMRLVMFAKTTNAAGQHVFGNWDMHQSWPESYWYFNDAPVNTKPSTDGVSVQTVQDIIINSDDPINPAPEFPTMALPAALIVGFIGAVLFVQKFKEN